MNKKAALITGAARRIGRQLARHLAKNGYNIALHYNNAAAQAKEIQNEIESTGGKCTLFACDFSNISKVRKLMDSVKKEFHYISLLINNASVFIRGTLIQTDLTLLNKTIDINFKAPFILARDYARMFDSGHIINILDTCIQKNKSNYFIYNLTKKNLADFTLMAAAELGPNIKVNGIAPGFILPPITGDDFSAEKKILKLPLQKQGNVSDITQAIDFLLQSEFITGQIIYTDGGEHL